VFEDDPEAYNIWKMGVGLPESRIFKLGEKDNFWGPAGGTGACGPCSEIYADLGPEYGCGKAECGPGCDCDRFSEVYNIVFPQFNQLADGTREPLKNRGIDTGMGMERLAMVSQGKRTIFETDLFAPVVKATEGVLGIEKTAENGPLFHVAVDHARALTFAIADGAIPSNEARGYILRSILRRALLFAHRAGVKEPFLYRVSGEVVEHMRQWYPELAGKREQAALIIKSEEERFLRTLDAGLELWEAVKEKYAREGMVPGAELFKLHDTFGLQVELVRELAEEGGVRLDLEGFEAAMKEQRERSRKATFIAAGAAAAEGPVETEFVGYGTDEADSELVRFSRNEDGSYELVLAHTPFYAEAGGQVGDTGRVVGEGFELQVTNTYSRQGVRRSRAELKSGEPKPGVVFAAVDRERRREIERAHTATHLLHAALRRVLGDYVKQEGSLVEPGRLRFDFVAFEPMKPEQIREVERLVCEQVMADTGLQVQEKPLAEAKAMGALAFFGEQYGETVRVVEIPGFSMELCGGTHLRATGEVGMFRITAETGVAAGIRRIEALVGRAALARAEAERAMIESLRERLGANEDVLVKKVEDLAAEAKRLDARVRQLSGQLARGAADELAGSAIEVAGVRTVVGHYPHFLGDELRVVADRLRELLAAPCAGLLTGAVSEGKLRYVVFVSPDLKERLPAGRLARVVGSAMGGGGGGRPDIAEGGGQLDLLSSGQDAFRQAFTSQSPSP
jgi:alanyl-tRNA synthetase